MFFLRLCQHGYNNNEASDKTVIFAFADALQLRLQSLGFQIPYQFLVMLPYVLTVVALAGVVGRSKGPAALGKAYSKEG